MKQSLDMGIINRLEDDCLAWCVWVGDDLANALDVAGIEPTEENINKLCDGINPSAMLEAMCVAGWDIINSAIDTVFRE